MEQLGIFITFIKANWFLSSIVTLSIIIVMANILRGLSTTAKVLFILFILGFLGVTAFALITFLS